MTRQQFIDKHKDELCGIIFDAMQITRTGSLAVMFMRESMLKVNSLLGDAFEQMTKEKPETKK